MIKIFPILLFTLTSLVLYSQSIEVRGNVFEDKNGNNIKDQGEPGISHIIVSDQVNTISTNTVGDFILKTTADSLHLFIIQPSGYKGKFYYPKSSTVNFPIQKTKPQKEFKFIHASDVHIDSINLPRKSRLCYYLG
jgi:hypothetical protein